MTLRVLLSVPGAVSGSKFTIILISLIAIVTAVDSQFIRIFYATDLGTPGNLQFSLFVVLVVIASIISILLLSFAKSIDRYARISRPLLFKRAFISTFCAQICYLIDTFFVISEMLIFHANNKIFLLLVVYLSHFMPIFILGMLPLYFYNGLGLVDQFQW